MGRSCCRGHGACCGPSRAQPAALVLPRPQYGNGSLRLTTRQTFQLHGVLKQNLKTVFSTVIKNMGSTLGACGDVNRNVMAPPAPYKDRPEYRCAPAAAPPWILVFSLHQVTVALLLGRLLQTVCPAP
jgi:hypothetical protein